MAAATLADQLLAVLARAGARRVYGVAGDSLNPLVDAVRRSERIEWVHVRNEEAGAFAAAAEAQLTGELAVCAGSCGPGNVHLMQGLYDANRSGAPVLAVASQIPSSEVGTGFFQETHPERTFVDCSRFCEAIGHVEQMPRIAWSAVGHALGGPGVAVLVIPGDVMQRPCGPAGDSRAVSPRATEVPDKPVVEALARRLNEAETVAVFTGAGAGGARGEVMELAARLRSPVGHSLRGKQWLQYDNPFDVGMMGLLGYGGCYDACHEADLLLMLGTDFPYSDFLPGKATVQVDRDPARLGRRTPLELAVHGDVKATLRAVLPYLEQKTDEAFLNRMLRHHHRSLEHIVAAYTHDVDDHLPIHPEYAARAVDNAAAADAIFTVDTGMCTVWAARYVTAQPDRRVIGSFIHGSMANALPQAIGAQLAYPGRQVVSLSGDGGLSMLLGELMTVAKYQLPIKIVTFNNSALGMIRLEMMVDGIPDAETDNGHFDYAAIAEAIGISGQRVDQPADLPEALNTALTHDGPALIDIVTDPNVLSVPPHVTRDEVEGFALATGRVVLAGGVGQMIDMARANARQLPRPGIVERIRDITH